MGKYKKNYIMIMALIFISLYVVKGEAQWVEQTITLEPGWNSIYLEVDPMPNQCDDIFGSIPVASVWTWHPKTSSVEYIQNPDTLLPKQSGWLVYFPTTSSERFLTNLFIMMGGRAYLIKLDGEETKYLSILGKPCLPKITWKTKSFNFVGFHLTPGEEPFFESFFSASPAHSNQPIYRLNENDTWEQIASPTGTAMRSGEAYWVYCNGSSDYVGPLMCKNEQGKGIDYGKTLVEQTFAIHNLTNNEVTISLCPLSSENPTDPTQPPVAGDVSLYYWKFEPQINEAGWTQLPALHSFTVAAEQEKLLRLAVKRAEMSPTGISQSILEVKNGGGMRLLVPVSAAGSVQSDIIMTENLRFRAGEISSDYAGLWVGSTVIKGVSQPADLTKPDDPNKPTGSEFQFPLIIHVDATGQARLLKEVIQMWAEGTWKEDPDDPTKQIVDEPGHFVLLTDDSLISQYSGAGIRGGETVGRRISSAAFSFKDPIDMAGSFINTGNLTCSTTIEPNDPLNPFKHKYHPDHNNLDEDGQYKEEAYRITREINLEFTPHDPIVSPEAEVAGWGDTDMGGIYRETITGLHKSSVNTKGFFYLHKVCPVAFLNDSGGL